MHNGYNNIDNKKMSKSEGNFFTVRDILKEFRGPAVRLFMLSAHYRNPINFSRELLTQSETAYDRILNCRENLKFIMEHPKDIAVDVAPAATAANEKFNAAMDDDLNTADAIGGIFEYIKEVNTLFENGGQTEAAKAALAALDTLLDVLGLLPEEADEAIPEDIRRMADERQAARASKDWAEADRLRDEIRARGYELKDTPDGVKINKI